MHSIGILHGHCVWVGPEAYSGIFKSRTEVTIHIIVSVNSRPKIRRLSEAVVVLGLI